MTSLSNIFRSSRTISKEGNIKEIAIRNLDMPLTDEAANDVKKEVLSREVFFLERDRMLKEARMTIEIEKSNLEHLRQTALDDIKDMQTAWQKEKIDLQQQAYDEGFQVGYEDGRNKAISEMSDAVKTANEVTLQSQDNALKYLDSQERVILEIAMSTANRILGTVLENDNEMFVSLVKRGLKEARETKEIKLYVSLDDYDNISANRIELAAVFPPDIPFLIFANEDFEKNDCIIETNQGRIVVSVDEQLNELKEKLVELMESGD